MIALALIAQIGLTVTAPDTVVAGESFKLVAKVSLASTRLPQVRAPDFSHFTIVRSEAIPRFTSGNWQRRAWIDAEYRYVLQAMRAGSYIIGPFEVRLDTQLVKSAPIRIVVRPGAAQEIPAIVARAKLDTLAPVNFRAIAVPETVYVGQQSMYQVGMFIDESVRGQLRRNPDFFAPEMRSMLAYDMPLRHTLSPVKRVGGRRYEAHIFQRAIFPLAAGRYALPPAQLVYSLAYTPSFFSREETHDLRTDSTLVYALEPPDSGRPPDYNGAVGMLRVAARLDTSVGRVGDPMLLTTRVTGVGNVKLFPRPRVNVPWATVVPSEERVYVDSSSLLVRGNKEFDWVLTPRIAGTVTLPPVSYPYFDPDRRRYEIATSVPETLSILPGTLTQIDSVATDTTPLLAIRTTYRGELPPAPIEYPFYWLVLALVPVPAAVLGVATRWRPGRRPGFASRHLRTLSGRPSAERVATIRRVYVNALGERLLVSPEELSRRGALARALRRAGATRDTAAAAEQLLRELDVAAYSGHGAPPPHAAKRAYELFKRIDAEAIERDGLPKTLLPVVLALLVTSASLYALAGPTAAAAAFERGVGAYNERQFNTAQAHFADVAQQAPRSPDAWANYGTSGWAAGRTAEATVGWQRAARLEPFAPDVRERLASLRGWSRGNLEWVPPVPPAPIAFVGAALWCLGWLALSIRAVGRAPRLKWWGPSVTIAGAVAILAAVQADTILAAKDLAVVMQPGPVRALPALAAEKLANLEAGQVVRALETRSHWALIQIGADREGWIESDRLTSIARDAQ